MLSRSRAAIAGAFSVSLRIVPSESERIRGSPRVRRRRRYVGRAKPALLGNAGTRQASRDRTGGGPFEGGFLVMNLFDAEGRLARMELFDPDREADALARFDALMAGGLPDPLRVPSNAASRTREVADDTAALRAIVSDDFVWEDRGKRALLRGGVDQYIQSMEFIRSRGGRVRREWIGARGDRIAIERVVLTGIGDSGEFEIELIGLAEVDAGGKLRAGMRFDPEDRGAAFEEAEKRFLAGEAAPIGGQAPFAAFGPAYRRRDWEAMRRCFADDAVVCDHRSLGIGAETPDEFVASARAQAELSPDAVAEEFRLLEWNRHGRVAVIRAVGSALHGGGPFERIDIIVFLTDGDRIQRLEPFDIGAVDAALARFAELCAERE